MNASVPTEARVRVLLATADPLLRETRRALIRSFGFEVIASSTVEDTTELLLSNRFELLVLGHSLTSKDCCAVAKVFRQHHPHGRIVEIASSPAMPPLNNPDATVVGMDGPDALRTILEQQAQVAQRKAPPPTKQ